MFAARAEPAAGHDVRAGVAAKALMDKAALKLAADRLFADMAGAMTAGLCHLGATTGLFRAMAGKGAMTCDDIADASGLQQRYVEEWLKAMTCARYLDYDPIRETFALPDEVAYFLASDGSDHSLGGLFALVPVLLRVAPDVAQAFA